MYSGRLKKSEWEIRPISLPTAHNLVRLFHYAKGASNTATYLHGLFNKNALWENECQGVAWWIPPTKSAAESTYPQNWRGVLALSRLVIMPEVPKNACSFLIGASMKLIDREKWPCLVTYADEWQGHTGTIYKATNWQLVGKTTPEATFIKNGRLLARKAGPHTRTRDEMEALGAEMIGKFAKTKYVHIRGEK